MANPRVHEIANELGIDSKLALDRLREMGELVRSASSTIAPPVARRLKASFPGKPSRKQLPVPIGQAALSALDAGASKVPRLSSLLVRALVDDPRGAFLATCAAPRSFFFADLVADPRQLNDISQSDLLSPAGFAIVRAPKGQRALLGWVATDRWLRLLFALLSDDSGALALDDFRTTEARVVDGKYRADGARSAALSLLAHMHESVPETTQDSASSTRSSARTARVRAANPDEVALIYVSRGGGRSAATANGPKRFSRWTVRGHFRRQWYSSTQDHKPIWIEEHSAGPADGIPLVRDIVRVIKPFSPIRPAGTTTPQ